MRGDPFTFSLHTASGSSTWTPMQIFAVTFANRVGCSAHCSKFSFFVRTYVRNCWNNRLAFFRPFRAFFNF